MAWPADSHRRQRQAAYLDVDKPDGNRKPGNRLSARQGHVVVMGLGMGWAAANAALHPAVSQVTVVEFDRK